MGLLVNGFNRTRDLHSVLITHHESGTGTNTETKEDTDIQTVISDTEILINPSTTTSQQLVKQGTLTSVSAVGETPTEMIWKRKTPELAASRIVFDGLAHTNEEDIIYETRWFYKGRFG